MRNIVINIVGKPGGEMATTWHQIHANFTALAVNWTNSIGLSMTWPPLVNCPWLFGPNQERRKINWHPGLLLLNVVKQTNEKDSTNVYASYYRACRLKKKAQHEANKVKLYGLEQEHRNNQFEIPYSYRVSFNSELIFYRETYGSYISNETHDYC